jgi:hypothetical protein
MIITGGAHLLEASPKKLCKALIFLVHVFILMVQCYGTPANSREERNLETIVNEQSSHATADLAKSIQSTHRQMSPDPYSWVGLGSEKDTTYNIVM